MSESYDPRAEAGAKARGMRSARAGMTRVITVTSGKGGVGKTCTVVNLAVELASRGRSVLVLDADMGLANVDVMLGLTPRKTLHDVVQGRCTLEQILIGGPLGVSILPAASGIEALTRMSGPERLMLLHAVEEIAARFDYLLIDTPAGIGEDVLFFNAAANEVIFVVNPEPTSLTDSYALMKLLAKRGGERKFGVLCNRVASAQEGRKAFGKLAEVAERFLGARLEHIGDVPTDHQVVIAVQNQRPVVESAPSSAAGAAWRKIGSTIEERFVERKVKGGVQLFFRQVVEAASFDA